MDYNKKLADVAWELCIELNKRVDKSLPTEIAKIVKHHALCAVVSAWIPVPGADVAAGATAIWSMYIRINGKLGIPFGKNIMKSVGSAIMTNISSYIAVGALGTALKFIPGIGSVAGAIIMSAGLYAATIASGIIYLKALTYLAKKNSGVVSDPELLMTAVNVVLKDKAMISSIIDSAKSDYKKNGKNMKLSEEAKKEAEEYMKSN